MLLYVLIIYNFQVHTMNGQSGSWISNTLQGMPIHWPCGETVPNHPLPSTYIDAGSTCGLAVSIAFKSGESWNKAKE